MKMRVIVASAGTIEDWKVLIALNMKGFTTSPLKGARFAECTFDDYHEMLMGIDVLKTFRLMQGALMTVVDDIIRELQVGEILAVEEIAMGFNALNVDGLRFEPVEGSPAALWRLI